jgi:nitroreductase
MDVAQAIRTKRAVRAFRPDPLPETGVAAILNAGRRSQSAKNRQPWHFVAIRDRSTLERLSGMGEWAGHLAGAALGVAIVLPDPAVRWSVFFDAGQAAAYMQLAAWNLGIGSCIATLHQSDAARQLLELPAEYQVHVALSFGYPEDPALLVDPPRPGGRRPLQDVVHFDRW